MTQNDSEQVSRRRQINALGQVVQFRSLFTVGIMIAGVFAAALESIDIGFIIPIVEIVHQSGDPASDSDGPLLVFVSTYQTLGVPFTLGTVIIGVSAVLTVRWTSTFLVQWLQGLLEFSYIREIQTEAFGSALSAGVGYFD